MRREKARLSEAVESVEEDAESLFDGVKARGRAGIAAVERQFDERPITSVLVALGAGVVIAGASWMVTRMMDR